MASPQRQEARASKDPAFSQIDLLSCRNLLIYLGPELQKEVIPAFHYALKPNGFLILGTSETIGGFPELYSPFDSRSSSLAPLFPCRPAGKCSSLEKREFVVLAGVSSCVSASLSSRAPTRRRHCFVRSSIVTVQGPARVGQSAQV